MSHTARLLQAMTASRHGELLHAVPEKCRKALLTDDQQP